MLQPARTKYRKQQKGRNTGNATRGAKVSFGEYGLKATTRGRLTARQLEAARRAMSRFTFFSWLVLESCCVASCMRRPNCARSRPSSSFCNSASSLERNSATFTA